MKAVIFVDIVVALESKHATNGFKLRVVVEKGIARRFKSGIIVENDLQTLLFP